MVDYQIRYTDTCFLRQPSTEACLFSTIVTKRTSYQGTGTDGVGKTLIIPQYCSSVVYITAMVESKVHDWASLAIQKMSLKKPNQAQMCPDVTKAKMAAVMFSGYKWMSLCATT